MRARGTYRATASGSYDSELAYHKRPSTAKMQTEGAIIEQDAVSRIESGSRLVTDYELLAMTKIFNVSADWIIGADKKPPRD